MSVTEQPRGRAWCPGEVRDLLPVAPEPSGPPVAGGPAAPPGADAPAHGWRARARALYERGAVDTATGRARWWAQLLVIAWLGWIYDLITDLAPVRAQAALDHGVGLLHLERVVHLDPELAMNHWLGAHHTLSLLVSDYYDNAHFAVTLGLLGWLWWRRPDIYPPLRNSLVLINVIGFAVFWRYPVAPPRLLVGAGFSDIVAATHAVGSFHSGSLATEANQLAAMPSLHMAWAAWSGLAMWRLWRGRVGLGAALGYPLLTALAVMATGNHYLIDVVAGVLTAGLATALVHIYSRRRAGPPAAPRGPGRTALERLVEPHPAATAGVAISPAGPVN